MQPDEKPDVSYGDIGGMDMQKQEMKEAVELPLTHFDLYKQVKKTRVANNHDREQIFGLDCGQQSIPIDRYRFQSIVGSINQNSMIVT